MTNFLTPGNVGLLLLTGAAFLLFSRFFFRIAPEGKLLVRTGPGGLAIGQPRSIHGTRMLVIPGIHQLVVLDVSTKRVEIARRGSLAAASRDGVRTSATVTLQLRVNNLKDAAVSRVVRETGPERASDARALAAIFRDDVFRLIELVMARFDFAEMLTRQNDFRDALRIEIARSDLRGFMLIDLAVEGLERAAD